MPDTVILFLPRFSVAHVTLSEVKPSYSEGFLNIARPVLPGSVTHHHSCISLYIYHLCKHSDANLYSQNRAKIYGQRFSMPQRFYNATALQYAVGMPRAILHRNTYGNRGIPEMKFILWRVKHLIKHPVKENKR